MYKILIKSFLSLYFWPFSSSSSSSPFLFFLFFSSSSIFCNSFICANRRLIVGSGGEEEAEEGDGTFPFSVVAPLISLLLLLPLLLTGEELLETVFPISPGEEEVL